MYRRSFQIAKKYKFSVYVWWCELGVAAHGKSSKT